MAECSDEVERTPARDCGLVEGFHLGSARRGLPRRRRTRRWSWRRERATTVACGERQSFGRQRRRGGCCCRGCGREWRRRGSRADRIASGGAGCCPDRCVHDAGVRPPRGRHWVERGGRLCMGEGRGGRAARLGWAEREAGRPSSACPLFFFFKLLFQKKA